MCEKLARTLRTATYVAVSASTELIISSRIYSLRYDVLDVQVGSTTLTIEHGILMHKQYVHIHVQAITS